MMNYEAELKNLKQQFKEDSKEIELMNEIAEKYQTEILIKMYQLYHQIKALKTTDIIRNGMDSYFKDYPNYKLDIDNQLDDLYIEMNLTYKDIDLEVVFNLSNGELTVFCKSNIFFTIPEVYSNLLACDYVTFDKDGFEISFI